MVSRPALGCICLALLPILVGCGGDGGGATATVVPDGDVQIESQQAAITIDSQGRLTKLVIKSLGVDIAPGDPQPVLELVTGTGTLAVESVELDHGALIATFDGGNASARIAVLEEQGYVIFRVVTVDPAEAEALRLYITLKRLDAVDPSLNGTHDDQVVACLRSTNAITRCIYKSLPGGIPRLGVEWTARHGIVGGSAGFVATPRPAFFDAVSALQAAEGLPSPRFDGVAARESPTARQSYFFLIFYRPGDLPALLDYARVGEFGSILLLRGLWRQSSGTYAVDPALWPGGMPEFTAFCDQIRAAGLGVGLHFYGPSISQNDPLVTPVPDDGLMSWPCTPLAAPVGAADTSLTLSAVPILPPPGGGGFPGKFLRVGDEIVRYTGTSASPPFTFTGCARGALGTTAAAHGAGEVPRQLATVNGLFLIDPDSQLVRTVAANLGAVVNAAGIEMVYFDGTAVVPTNESVQRWYYMNKLLPAYDAAFDHSVLVQTGMGPGRELDWHLVPRSASADGHGDIKWYLDQRTPSIESIRRGLSVPDVGWYGFDSGRPPDYLEYVCAKSLGWQCGLSVQSFKLELDQDRRARETMEMLGRYERCKRAAVLPQSVRDALLVQGQDFRLLEDAAGDWMLFEAAYDVPRDVRTLTGGTYTWTATNPEATSRPLGVEITRGDAIRVNAVWSDPAVMTLELFQDVDPFAPDARNDSARLVTRVDKVLNPAGPARNGVSHNVGIVQDANVGGPCMALTASNGNNTVGWCAVGRTFDTLLDVSSLEALGLWSYGDKSGVEITMELWDDKDGRATFRLPVFFEGWRLHALPLTTSAAFDRSRVKYLVLIVADITPNSDIETRFVLLRGTPTVVSEADLTGVSIKVGARTIDLPAPLPPGGTARIDALGRLTIWPGGMAAGQIWNLAGGPVMLAPGANAMEFAATGPDPFPGDVTVRLSRLKQIHPE